MKIFSPTFNRLSGSILLLLIFFSSNLVAQQETIAPPAMGEETKGTPAIPEGEAQTVEPTVDNDTPEQSTQNTSNSPLSALGTATITESKRENGQVYRIELEHSLGGKQYIEENDSDGKIQSTSNDIEETPNLPKWKIGSW